MQKVYDTYPYQIKLFEIPWLNCGQRTHENNQQRVQYCKRHLFLNEKKVLLFALDAFFSINFTLNGSLSIKKPHTTRPTQLDIPDR